MQTHAGFHRTLGISPIYTQNSYRSFFLLTVVLVKGSKPNVSLLQGISGMKNGFTMRKKSKSQTFSVIHGC